MQKRFCCGEGKAGGFCVTKCRHPLLWLNILNCEYANFHSTMAYPGSLLYEKSIENGVEMPDNWLGFSQLSEETFPLPTKHLSNVEVLRFRDQAFQEYFSNPQYLKMIEEKFGAEVVEHINQMLKHKLHRNILNQPEVNA